MRKLRVGIVGGGGGGSFFGKIHLRACSLDGTREVVAGALRSTAEGSLAAAKEWGIKGFPDYNAMIEAVVAKKLKLDYITIATPNFAHYAPAKACLEAGIPVLCEKPITMTVPQAQRLHRLAARNDVPFILSHTYTGHPMMMYARELVKGGAIGEVRKVESWYNQGWLATRLESGGQQQAAWRTDPKRAGISNCGGDIGTHAFVAATWVTGLSVKKVSARLSTFVEGRPLDDDFNVVAELSNGATALIWASQIAIGHKNDCGFRIFGTTGSIEWDQERAEKLNVFTGEICTTYWLGGNFSFFPPSIGSYLRSPSGHHEDFFEALANLHCSLERQIRRRNGEKGVPEPYPHPATAEGVAGMKFVAAAVASSRKNGAWTNL